MNSYTELHKNPINGSVADTVTDTAQNTNKSSWKLGSQNIWSKKEEVKGRWNICAMRSWIICSPRQTYEQIKKIRNTWSMHGIRKQKKTVVSKPQTDLDVERRRVLKSISLQIRRTMNWGIQMATSLTKDLHRVNVRSAYQGLKQDSTIINQDIRENDINKTRCILHPNTAFR